VEVTRYETAPSWLEIARRAPAAPLAAHFTDYGGYEEGGGVPVRRREVPHGRVVLILGLGEPIEIAGARAPSKPETLTSFVAGMHDEFTLTEHGGRQRGIQVDLTPLGAYRLFGLPMHELANEVVGLDTLFGRRRIETLTDQLASASTWEDRFAELDATLMAWIADGPEPDRSVAWAWQQLDHSAGRVPVATLANEIGWSRRHFANRFREHIGLGPKATGRVLRFRRAVQLLDTTDAIASVAADCGYADHSHLVHDFQSLAGCTPTELRARRFEGYPV
jgi:AraC-like DNA-binding protein